MILQALKGYYDRKAADPDSGIAPPGWERKELPFLVVLRPDGSPAGIEDTREPDGKKLRAKTFMVPHAVKRTVGMRANLLWDDPEYALALVVKGDAEKAAAKNCLFVTRIHDEGLADIPEIKAVLDFLDRPDKLESLSATSAELYEELKKASFISFRITGSSEPVFRNPQVVGKVGHSTPAEDAKLAFCTVSEMEDEVDLTHPAIKGVWGANTTGGNIVGFNAPAFCSYGKLQGANAQIGKAGSFAYTTALNTLLGKDSRQRIQVGDASTVFWSEKKTEFEDLCHDFFAEPPPDNPDQLTEAVAALYRSVQTGAFTEGGADTEFYVLGLAPNAARLSVRFWHVAKIAVLASNFRQYFEDLRIIHGPRDRDDLSLWRLLVSTAVQGKSENINPKLAGQVMHAILAGLPFPDTLLQAAIMRVKAEREVTYPRAKIIKGCLNRNTRIRNNTTERMLAMSLDKENTNIGYRLGRLFAVLEKIQQEANPGINATIRDRFYAAASSVPSTVFGNLMRLENHHLAKLEHPGRRIWFEKLLGEIFDGIPAAFPAHLNLADQGRFAIGYYHQVQDLWTRKADKASAI